MRQLAKKQKKMKEREAKKEVKRKRIEEDSAEEANESRKRGKYRKRKDASRDKTRKRKFTKRTQDRTTNSKKWRQQCAEIASSGGCRVIFSATWKITDGLSVIPVNHGCTLTASLSELTLITSITMKYFPVIIVFSKKTNCDFIVAFRKGMI